MDNLPMALIKFNVFTMASNKYCQKSITKYFEVLGNYYTIHTLFIFIQVPNCLVT